MSLTAFSHLFACTRIRSAARGALALAALLICACSVSSTEPTGPLPRRTNDVACVSPGNGDTPPDTVPVLPGGGCAPGFDQVSWW